ncbi:protein NLRC5-like [Protopterus annectens]|uniref:protein NLRC5-like n=1 Tax=Protopterus annectens TaxID=7888 RepID=UPI001CF9F402|nr:protein NLRC5-like [Protopterus annectens]
MNGIFALAHQLTILKNIIKVEINLGISESVFLIFKESQWEEASEKQYRNSGSTEYFLSKKETDENDRKLFKKFSLKECQITPQNMDKLCKILEKCSELAELDLSSNVVSHESVKRLLDHLSYFSALKLLNISDNNFSTQSVLLLARTPSVYRQLHEVEVRSQGKTYLHFETKGKQQEVVCRLIECNLDKKNSKELSESLWMCTYLTELDLSGNLLEDEGLISLLSSLPTLPIFKVINASNNKITQRGVLSLIDTLNACSSIAAIDVSLYPDKKLLIMLSSKDEDKEMPSGSLNYKNGPGVAKRISLKKCDFQTEHLAELCAVLERCTSIGELELRNNGLPLNTVKDLLRVYNGYLAQLIIRIEEPWICANDVLTLLDASFHENKHITEIQVYKTEVEIRLNRSQLVKTGNVENTDISSESATISTMEQVSLIQCGLEALHLPQLKQVIGQCSNLRELNLSYNDLGDAGAMTVSEILQSIPALKILRLESTGITTEGITHLTAGLEKCTTIEEINLSKNEIGVKGAVALAKSRLQEMELKRINLSNCSSLASRAGTNLIEMLSKCTSLEEINLSSLQLDEAQLAALVSGVHSMPFLKKLVLSNNRMGDKVAQSLGKYLPSLPMLKKLNLSQNGIGVSGGKKLVDGLVHCSHIEELQLSTNSIGDDAVIRMAEALPSMASLKILNLQSNSITSFGALQLIERFIMCPQLEEISLSENKIGEECILKLAEGLPHLKHLRKLHLKLNEISNGASIHLAASLGYCATTEEVVISWNSIGDATAVKLAEVLPRMRRLKKLDLEHNKITVVGAKKLAESLSKCPVIEVIRLWKNQISREFEHMLQNQDPRLNFSFFNNTSTNEGIG